MNEHVSRLKFDEQTCCAMRHCFSATSRRMTMTFRQFHVIRRKRRWSDGYSQAGTCMDWRTLLSRQSNRSLRRGYRKQTIESIHWRRYSPSTTLCIVWLITAQTVFFRSVWWWWRGGGLLSDRPDRSEPIQDNISCCTVRHDPFIYCLHCV